MKIDLLDPVVEVSPGDTAVCRVRVHNDSPGPSAYTLRVVGLYDVDIEYPLGTEPLPSGAEARFDVSLDVPREFAAGRHALAVEVTSDRRDERSVLTGVTVDVSSIQKVALRVNPGNIRGHRTGRFRVELDNLEQHPVDLELEGHGQDLDFRFGRRKVQMRPGDSVSVSGSVRGARRFVRDSSKHIITVSASGRSQPIYAEASFEQRPIIPTRFRSAMAILALLGLWAGILGGAAYWYSQRDNGDQSAQVDTDGDGVPDAPLGSLPANPDGSTGQGDGSTSNDGGSTGAGTGPGSGAAGAGVNQRPTSTTISGTVKAGETGDNAGVNVTLTPATLGGIDTSNDPARAAALSRGDAGPSSPGKVWPSRYGRAATPGVVDRRATESVLSAFSDREGVWLFSDVTIPDNYEVSFSKPGFDTKAFIVTPPEDGKAVSLDVQLDPASGAASGVVYGPSGPLGGVEIVITDGVLRFATKTSSQAGSVGQWSMAGLSTPNTYTLTATLRGYGTEVQQLTLAAGQQRAGLSVTMAPGVAAVSGMVTTGGEPLGAVSITATNGDLSRTTTSLTLGNSGSFSLPQLDIPGTYTVTASADGYLTQTRVVDLTGNVDGIDFAMVRTTGSITGVTVSTLGGNLAGVGITVSGDNLTFGATTAAAPSAGSFRIDELPPGDYLVTFARYDHAEVSQRVTITAGVSVNLGEIEMTYRQRAPLNETGRLVVSVQNSSSNPLGGATIALLRIADGTVVRTITDTSGTETSLAFDNVPIGTYNLRVSRPSYRTQTRRISMGLSVRTESFTLLQNGQVSGRVVDAVKVRAAGALGDAQLNNYEVKIFRLNADGSRNGAEIERITVPSSQGYDDDGNILFQSAPTSLTDGTYEVEVSVVPVGFRLQPGQNIDPNNSTSVMRFTIGDTVEGAIRLKDIRVDPYPSFTGRVLEPTTAANPFKPLANARVKLTCAGQPGSATVTTNANGVYTFTRVVIDQQELIGTCSAQLTSPAFRTADVTLPVTLEVSSNGISSDKIVNMAIGRNPAAIGGPLTWRDRTTDTLVPVPDVGVVSVGNVLVGYSGVEDDDTTASPAEPPGPLYATGISGTNVGGTWSIFGQLFGPATYRFDGGAKYVTDSIVVDIADTGRTVTGTANITVNDTNPSIAAIAVELTPNPGTITGTVAVDTVSADPADSQPPLSVDALRSPDSPSATVPVATAVAGTFAFTAAAGTWDLLFTAPPGYRFYDTGAVTETAASTRVEPTATVPFHARLVQLAELDIRVVNAQLDVGGDPAPFAGPGDPTVDLVRTASGLPGDPGAATIPVTLDQFGAAGDFRAEIDGLEVNWHEPTTVPANYEVSVAKSGYDIETVSVDIDGVVTEMPGTAIPVELLAGQSSTITITLTRHGSIDGIVKGNEPGQTGVALRNPSGTTMTATRLYLPDGTTATTTPTVAVTVDSVTGAFSFSGPPGYYEIAVANPWYDTNLASAPAGSVAHPDLYLMENATATSGTNTLASSFVLQILPTSVTVDVTGSGAALSDATVTLRRTGNADLIGTTNGDGKAVFATLPAGVYEVRVRKLSGINDERFPVFVTVNTSYGQDPTVRNITVSAELVALDGEITGTVRAINSLGTLVPLPAGFDVHRNYTVAAGNSATEDDLVGTNPPNTYTFTRPSASSTDMSILMDNLPRGLHQLTFDTAAGYTTPTPSLPIDATIGAGAYSIGTVSYVADNVRVAITLSGFTDSVSDGRPTVVVGPTSPATQGAGQYTAVYDSDESAYIVTLPPHTSAWNVTVTHPLYATATEDITVNPQAGTYSPPAIALTATKSNISGNALKEDAPGVPVALQSQGTATLRLVSDPATAVATSSISATGQYRFPAVEGVGPFVVRVELTGYTTATSASFSPTLGTDVTGPTVTITKLAGASITVTGANAAPTATATAGASVINGTCLTASSCEFTGLVGGTEYTIDVTPNASESALLWAGSTTITPAVGATATGSVTLANRIVVVTVNVAGATVTLTPTGGAPVAPTSSSPATNPTTFSFENVPKVAGSITISAVNYLNATQTYGADAAAGPDAGDNVSVTLQLAQTAVSGTISGVPTGFTGSISVNATSPGSTDVPGVVSVDTTGPNPVYSYSFPSLGWGSWTITASGYGAGAGSSSPTVDVNGTASSTATRNIALTPRTVYYQFTVNGTGGTGLNGAAVAFGSGTAVTTSGTGANAGKADLSILETANPAFTVAANGYVTYSGTAGAGSFSSSAPTAVAPVQLSAIPVISGATQDAATTPAPVNFTNVYLCAGSAPGTGDPCGVSGGPAVLATVAQASTPAPSFAINTSGLRLAPGSYHLRATAPSLAGTINFSISSTGALSPAGPFTITLS